jgi:hypothetical protein
MLRMKGDTKKELQSCTFPKWVLEKIVKGVYNIK